MFRAQEHTCASSFRRQHGAAILLMQPPNILVPCETTRVKMGSDRHLGITVTAALTSKVLLCGESSAVAPADQRAEFTCH